MVSLAVGEAPVSEASFAFEIELESWSGRRGLAPLVPRPALNSVIGLGRAPGRLESAGPGIATNGVQP